MDFDRLKGEKVLITGASGLIGRALTARLLKEGGIKVVACVRDLERAHSVFAGLPQENLEYLVGDVALLPIKDMGIGYIVHGANRTASKEFVSEPVEVIESAVNGTKRVLEFARVNRVKGLAYLSTMEVYGTPTTDGKITENSPAVLDTMSVRSSYPESKRLCECLCAAYASEYQVPARVVRLTQTFGPGVSYSDGRVFAEFARCAIEGRDIILKTKGETKRSYLFTEDAVTAILTVLLFGAAGEAYNAANEETYCSVYDMAEMVAEQFGNGKTSVKICEDDPQKYGYAPTLKMNLSTQKLRALGWKAETNLVKAYASMIADMQK